MATTITGPDDLVAWLTEMRDVGEIAPLIAVIRDGRLIASGFTQPPFNRTAAVAMYGFRADAIAVAFDAAVTFTDVEADEPPTLPALPMDLVAAGDPNSSQTMFVQWVPRGGASTVLQRRYSTFGDAVVWIGDAEPLDGVLVMLGPLLVDAEALARTIDHFATRLDADGVDALDLVDRRTADRLTAQYLGLELR